MKRLLEENIELRYTTKEEFELDYMLTAAKMLSKLPNFPKKCKEIRLVLGISDYIICIKKLNKKLTNIE